MRLKNIAIYCTAVFSCCNAQEITEQQLDLQAEPMIKDQEPSDQASILDQVPPNGASNVDEDQFTFINDDAKSFMNKGDNQYFNQFVIKLNDSIVATLKEMDIVDGVKHFLDFMYSKEWIEAVEMGTNQQVVDALGQGIDPLTSKLMGVYGPDMAVSLPIEMLQWVKDTTVLWVKNKGAGHAMSEEVAIEQNQVQQLNQQIREMRAYYDQQVKKYTNNLEEMEQKLFELRVDNQAKDEQIEYLQGLMGSDLGQGEEKVQNLIDQHQEEKNVLNQEKIQEIQRIKANASEECTQAKRDILKTLNQKYQQSTKKLTGELTEIWQQKYAELQEKVGELQAIDEGIRMSIKKNDQGIFYMSEIVRSDESYDLDGVIFEFTRADQAELFYMIREKSKDEFCSDDLGQMAEVQPEAKPEPIPEIKPFEFHEMRDYVNTCMNDIVHHCDECGTHQLYDKVWDRHNCIDNHFCFLYHEEPHCGNCSVFGSGCKSCTYRNKCLQCYSGYWLMSGLCIKRPW